MRERETRLNRFESAVANLGDKVLQAKSQWLTDLMAKLIPSDINSAAHVGKLSQKRKVKRYLARHNIRIAEHPDRTDLLKDGKVVGTFQAQMLDGELRVIARDMLDNASPDGQQSGQC